MIHGGFLALRALFSKNIFAEGAAFSDTNLAYPKISLFPPQNNLILPPHRDCTREIQSNC
jgi:hypothetical protein